MKKTAKTLLLLLFAVALFITACTDTETPSTPNTPSQGITDDFNESDVKEIKLSGMKTSFSFAENFSFDDLVVTLIMSDNSEKVLNKNDYTVSCNDYSSMKVGTYKATVQINNTNLAQSYDVSVLQANKLKVLMIGNSFADDTINYAYEIAKSAGIPAENIVIADIYIGGCSLQTHWENAQSGAAAYRFGLEREGWFDGSSYTNWTIDQAIMYTDWDFITFQQNSGNSGTASTYSCLQNLMDYVYDIDTDEVNHPNANPNVKFVWHQTWAYQQNTSASAFANYNYDQMTMFNAIQSCRQLNILTKDFVAIIPNGTAIQNARTSFSLSKKLRDVSTFLYIFLLPYKHYVHYNSLYIISFFAVFVKLISIIFNFYLYRFKNTGISYKSLEGTAKNRFEFQVLLDGW